MLRNGFKCKNVPPEYLESLKKSKKSDNQGEIPIPDDLDWSYIFSNEQLSHITKTSDISSFCKSQHLKYVAHVTRLDNNSFQKQILFSTDHKKFARDCWVRIEKELNLPKVMQNKKEFTSLLKHIYK